MRKVKMHHLPALPRALALFTILTTSSIAVAFEESPAGETKPYRASSPC